MVLFLALVVALLAGAALLGSLAIAVGSRSRAQGAADASALAAAGELRDRLYSTIAQSGSDGALEFDDAAAQDAARRFAAANGALLKSYNRDGLRVDVTVEALRGGEEVALADASAELVIDATWTGPAGSSSDDGATDAGNLRPRTDSALFAYGSNCATGIDVGHLAPAMKTAVVVLEDALGERLELTSGYRTYECQARLYGTVSGPVALPGRSLHNVGMAIDVQRPEVVAPYAAAAKLCQPFPQTDPEHFSLSSGPECGGHRGSLDGGQTFSGGLDRYLNVEIRLMDTE
jgi:hypothetical protein